MPARIKYTREQRKQVADLYAIDRGKTGSKSKKGKYTLKEIEQMTGVKAAAAWLIATGQR